MLLLFLIFSFCFTQLCLIQALYFLVICEIQSQLPCVGLKVVADCPDHSGTPGNPHTTLASVNTQVTATVQKLDLMWDEFSAPRSS